MPMLDEKEFQELREIVALLVEEIDDPSRIVEQFDDCVYVNLSNPLKERARRAIEGDED